MPFSIVSSSCVCILFIYIPIYLFPALNDPLWLICRKTKQKQNKTIYLFIYLRVHLFPEKYIVPMKCLSLTYFSSPNELTSIIFIKLSL